jgi:hypothetical protein
MNQIPNKKGIDGKGANPCCQCHSAIFKPAERKRVEVPFIEIVRCKRDEPRDFTPWGLVILNV